MTTPNSIFLNCAGSRTQLHVMTALHARGAGFRAYGRHLAVPQLTALGATSVHEGALTDEAAVADAMRGATTVVHVAPALQAREVAMGRLAIDVARRQGVRHFVYISVLSPQISHLMNHRTKLEIEDYLVSSGLCHTILRPMHYFQNLDVAAAARSGRLQLTYDVATPLSFVDMADVGEVAAMVATATDGAHDYASYDLCSADCLSGAQLAAQLAAICGRAITAERIPLADVVAMLTPHLAADKATENWTASAIERLFLYYSRFGFRGNANVLRWLLGREPGCFGGYARRQLAA